MARLISLVRSMVGDLSGPQAAFGDDDIERSLDAHRWDMRQVPLKTLLSPAGEGKEWYSDEQFWEDDTTLVNESNTVLTPFQNNAIYGRWTLDAAQKAVYAYGSVYDPYAAAADLLEMLAARVAPEYDVVADGTSLHRSQKQAALRQMAANYRSMQRIVVSRQVRDDV